MLKTLLALTVVLTACASDWAPDPRCDATGCSKYGWCQYDSNPDAYRCHSTSDADCQQAVVCQKFGACYVRAGGGMCVSTKPKGK